MDETILISKDLFQAIDINMTVTETERHLSRLTYNSVSHRTVNSSYHIFIAVEYQYLNYPKDVLSGNVYLFITKSTCL